MSLGTVVPTNLLSNKTKIEIFRAFEHFSQYHFLWKIDQKDEFAIDNAKKYPNVDIADWIPQADLLGVVEDDTGL
jgi:hypothetical protein